MEVAGNTLPFRDTSFIRTKIQCNVYKSCSKHLGGGGGGTSFALTIDFIEDMWFHYWGNDGHVVQGEIVDLGY